MGEVEYIKDGEKHVKKFKTEEERIAIKKDLKEQGAIGIIFKNEDLKDSSSICEDSYW